MAMSAEDWALLLGGGDGANEGREVAGAVNELTFMSELDTSDSRFPEIQLVVIRRNNRSWDYPLSNGEKRERTILLYEKELGVNEHVIDRLNDRTQRHRSERRELRDDVVRSQHQVSALREENQRIITNQLRERTQVGSEHEVAALKATSRLLQERAEEAHQRLQSTQQHLKACAADRAKREMRSRTRIGMLRRRVRTVRTQMAHQRRKALAKRRQVHVKKMQQVLTQLAEVQGKRAKQEAHLSWLKEKSESERQMLKRLAYMMHEFIRNWEKLSRFLRERDAARVEEAVQTQSALIQEAEVSLLEFDVPPPPARLPLGPGDEVDGKPGEGQQHQVQHRRPVPHADVVHDSEESRPSIPREGIAITSVRKKESCESLSTAASKHHSWSWAPPAAGSGNLQRASRVEAVHAAVGSARSSTCLASSGPYSARSSQCTFTSTRSGSLEPLDRAMLGMHLKVTPPPPLAWRCEPEPRPEVHAKHQPTMGTTHGGLRCVPVATGVETPRQPPQPKHQQGAETPRGCLPPKHQSGAETPRGCLPPKHQGGADTPRGCHPPAHFLAGVPSPCRAQAARHVVTGLRAQPVTTATGAPLRHSPEVVRAGASGHNSNVKNSSGLSTALISPRFAPAGHMHVAGASATTPVRILQPPL
mmetsp:Transcript_146843/g.267681  ORF Transcript_146843/g.267681 Transcript_146843/m.267681 type:complete len:647 (-) Transcript_146843:84-2024(-)